MTATNSRTGSRTNSCPRRSASARPRKPITAGEAALVFAYLSIALARQIAHDVRTIVRWARS